MAAAREREAMLIFVHTVRKRSNFTCLRGGGLHVVPTVEGRRYVASTALKELEGFAAGGDGGGDVVGGGNGRLEAEGMAD